ncbi:MAG TPA: hypothetical protein VFT29_14585 [Gemmatimonadaceae bacterium]|nr:hypothetical protein [Gemmatimonadaceae bacterium]
MLSRLKELAARDPSTRTREPFKAALDGDVAYFHEAGDKKILDLVYEPMLELLE